MGLQILQVNREIIKLNYRSNGWVSIVLFFILFFPLPFNIAMKMSQPKDHFYFPPIHSLFDLGNSLQVFFMLFGSMLVAILQTRYMQRKSSSIFMHSLPLKRSTLFHHQVINGVLFLVIPIILNAILLFIFYHSYAMEKYFPVSYIQDWLFKIILFSLFMYISTILVGILTGLSSAQGVLSIILQLFPYGISTLFLFNLKQIIFGFPMNYYNDANLFMKLSGVVRILDIRNVTLSFSETIGYVILSITFYLLALWIYSKRNTESANHLLAFSFFTPIFRYGVTFCTMLLGGIYLGEGYHNFPSFIIGYVMGSMIGYFTVEMIINKTWQVFEKWKGYISYIVIVLVIFIGFHFAIQPYEKALPKEVDIQNVYFGNYISRLMVTSDRYVKFHSPETIKAIYQVNWDLLTQQNYFPAASYQTINLSFIYHLKDGSAFIRNYVVRQTPALQKDLNILSQTQEYKLVHPEE